MINNSLSDWFANKNKRIATFVGLSTAATGVGAYFVHKACGEGLSNFLFDNLISRITIGDYSLANAPVLSDVAVIVGLAISSIVLTAICTVAANALYKRLYANSEVSQNQLGENSESEARNQEARQNIAR